ncbi:hypothetical protein CC86DRAFT_414115 [Ophiobolus disseminans]|uniref:Uncharacterized protein n=1 Tax=Ophiobolus disseminans TaxID=1469910 RepID=A0A6A6ZBZ7_9PLEO|nr:hypothetical protein CC86DRAFT_414115 [Ophiobolus disseminans]
MTLALLVSFAVCSSVAIPLSGMLIYHDINDKANDNNWKKIFAALPEACQMSLSGAGLYAVVVALRSSTEVYWWYNAVVLCSLQLSVGNNLARILRTFLHPRWTIWLIYVLTVLTALDILYMAIDAEAISTTTSLSLMHLAATSSLSSALLIRELKKHRDSGALQSDRAFPQLLRKFIAANTVPALVQMCGGITIVVAALATKSDDIWWYRWIILSCAATQLLSCLPFSLARIDRHFVGPIAIRLRTVRSTLTANSDT